MSDNIQKLGNEPTNPTYFKDGEIDGCGLTKREYFAGLLLQGFIANSSICPFIEQGHRKILAQEAVIMSDELLKALENEN